MNICFVIEGLDCFFPMNICFVIEGLDCFFPMNICFVIEVFSRYDCLKMICKC